MFQRLVALIALGAGVGLMLAAINQSWPMIWLCVGVMAGCGVFYLASEIIDRRVPHRYNERECSHDQVIG